MALASIFVLSGAAALGHEIAWVRLFGVGFGHESAGFLAVVGAFFGGLAAGSLGLDRRISRSARPGLWYAALEALIGLWALATTLLVQPVNQLAAQLLGAQPAPLYQWLVSFALPFVALLPATFAMGASFPAAERLTSRLESDGLVVSRLYALNTAGGVVGTVLATFWLIPRLGVRSALITFALTNFLAAGLILLGPARGEARRSMDSEPASAPSTVGPRRTLWIAGFLGLGYEVVIVRALGQVLENTVYSFATVLVAYLLATALGAALYRSVLASRNPERTRRGLLLGLAVSVALSLPTLAWVDDIYQTIRSLLGFGMGASIVAEVLTAASVLAVPAMLSGALFSHLAAGLRSARGGIGLASGINTLGAALAPPIIGVWMLPALGIRGSIAATATGYLALAAWRSADNRKPLLFTAFAVFLLAWIPVSLVDVPPGGRLLAERQGVLAHVAVVESTTGQLALKVNNQFTMGGTASAFGEARLGHVPLLLHGAPTTALFLGVGTGFTARAAAVYPGLSAEGVELVAEVLEMLPYFAGAAASTPESNLRWLVADGARYVRAIDRSYDVIVADLFHPARDGAGSLYTFEHFEEIRRHLAPRGLFCQWLPLYQLDRASFDIIVRTFLAVFPDARAHLAYFNVSTPALGLIGRDATYAEGPPATHTPRSGALLEQLQALELADEVELAGTFLLSGTKLRGLVGEGVINTHDRPFVTFQAPRFVYREPTPSWSLLVRLLEAREGYPDTETTSPLAGLADYLRARDAYLRAEIALQEGDGSAALRHYVESARASSLLRAPYFRLLQLAQSRAADDPVIALRILDQAQMAQPELTEAARVRERILSRPR